VAARPRAPGWRWLSGESETRRAPAELEGLELHGYIDRIDRREGKDGATIELIDYKTGSAEKLKERCASRSRTPSSRSMPRSSATSSGHGELSRRRSHPGPDPDRASPRSPTTRAPSSSASPTRCGACAAGAGLRALGEGSACEYCRARGLCRRDHWASDDDGA
jgi:ATP-dependent helicase/nuclease subunit B